MKQIFYMTFLPLLALAACNGDYEFSSTGFTAPGAISGPAQVTVDPASQQTVVFSWEASDVDDGTWVLYDVIFDHPDGDFSDPFRAVKSDGGTQNKLTFTQTALNEVARDGGIDPAGSGSFIWTVRAYRGGATKYAPESKALAITRPDVLDVPEQLYIFGTALTGEQNGARMNPAAPGVFLYQTVITQSGYIWFCSSADPGAKGALRYYYDAAANRLMQGEGTTAVTPDEYAVDITVNFGNRSFSAEAPFEAPGELYLQGAGVEAGRKFSRQGDTFILYTKFASASEIYFTASADAGDERRYYINDGKLSAGGGTTTVPATPYTANKIVVNTTSRSMTLGDIDRVQLEWVNAMTPVDVSNRYFSYSSNGNFTLTFNIPTGFTHTPHEAGKPESYNTDARYFISFTTDPTREILVLDDWKNIADDARWVRRWGCKLTAGYNMTVEPYLRPAAPPTHADIWIPVFETGIQDGNGVDTEEIVEQGYRYYNQMPDRWQANWFFKTAWAGTQRTATIYTDRDGKMGLHIE